MLGLHSIEALVLLVGGGCEIRRFVKVMDVSN